MHSYVVGEVYNPNARRAWPQAGAQWRLSEDGVELVVFLADPTPAEVEAFEGARARFALLAGEHALILAYRFGALDWWDSPWQACRQSDVTAGLAAVAAGEHLAVNVVLVDSVSGRIKVLRLTTWPGEFAAAVAAAISAQIHNQSSDAQGAAEIAAWYRAYATTDDLVRAADIITPDVGEGRR